jgi:hypothetical protein
MLKEYGRYSAYCMVILVLLVLLTGCAGDGGQPTLDLMRLQVQLVAEYGGSNVVAALQDARTLSVAIADEAFTGPARDLGLERAREVAEFVCKHYGSMGGIDTVEVQFEIRRDGSVVDASGRLAYAFARSELDCGKR